MIYIVLAEFRFERNRDFLALLLLPFAGGLKDGKRFYVDCLRGTQREYSSKPFKQSIVKRILVFKR